MIRQAIEERIKELKEIAKEEGISVNPKSEKGMIWYTYYVEPTAIFLLDNGNFKCRFENKGLTSFTEFVDEYSINAHFFVELS